MSSAARAVTHSYAGDVSPADAWTALSQSANAQLIDVRTQAEWAFAGVPSVDSLNKTVKTISWKFYPNFDVNPRFIEQLETAVTDKSAPLYFLCKTGGRSADAAIAATSAGYHNCYNIAGGFEGDINTNHQRGQVNGWKASRLPWQQA
ncbi:MAG: rhodanese-like domain-containing protein [Rickettsiales bacterium]